jgi:hypothetical protein
MRTATYLIDSLIDTVVKRLVGQDSSIASQAAMLKREIAVSATRLGSKASIMAPVYEALIAEPELAIALGIKVTFAGGVEEEQAKQINEALMRNKDKKEDPPVAAHVASDNTLYIFEFTREPNLVREATSLHMQRASGDRTRQR